MALRIDRKVVLASASPSRKMLLEQAGVDFEVVVSGVDETVPPEFTPAQTVETLAQRKGEAVLALRPEMPIIAADSVVSIDGLILGRRQRPPCGDCLAAPTSSSPGCACWQRESGRCST